MFATIKNKISLQLRKLEILILKHGKCKNIILFESCPDFNDNSLEIYNELIKRGYNKKYKLIWISNKKKNTSQYKTIYNNGGFRYTYFICKSKYLICNNMFLYELNPNQTSIYLCHGSPTKKTSTYYYPTNKISAIISQSPIFKDEESIEYHFPKENIFSLGLPRVDSLLSSKCDINKLFNFKGKILFWYPTFKSSTFGSIHGSGLFIDLLKDENDINQLNSYCAKNNVLIVIKLHWSSINKELLNVKKSNLVFVDDDFFEKFSTTSYKALAKSDALITDYSSVFYDYLVTNKPICFVFTDIEQYNKNPGLNPSFLDNSKCGHKVFNQNDLFAFISDVCNGNDIYSIKRKDIKEKVFPFKTPYSTERVVDFIIHKYNI